MKKDNLVEMAYCTRAHGLKGEFQWSVHNLHESSLDEGLEVTLFPSGPKSLLPKEGKTFKIQSIRWGNKIIVTLESITTRNQVDEMLPYKVMMSRDDFSDLEEGEFYVIDLHGLDVYSEDEVLLGKVQGHYENGEQTVLTVKLLKGEVIELPLVDQFFPQIEIENKRIVMVMPEWIE